ncbi:MAG: hypothetical protein ACPGVU_21895 [Limisphaerales bacterium]
MSRKLKNLRTMIATACALVLLTGCSGFNRDWKNASAEPLKTDSIEGTWKGTWLSDHNGHNGGLRAIITKLDADTYNARFHATYMRILTFGQTVDLTVKQEGTNYTFTGEADLGKAYGGIYTYKGKMTTKDFFSTYNCSIDHGTFKMSRPEQ